MFGADKIAGLLENFRVADDMPIESDLVAQALDKVPYLGPNPGPIQALSSLCLAHLTLIHLGTPLRTLSRPYSHHSIMSTFADPLAVPILLSLSLVFR